MEFAKELTAKVMGEILAKGMSLSEVDLSESVNSEAVKVLGEIKTALAQEAGNEKKLERVQQIVNQYKME